MLWWNLCDPTHPNSQNIRKGKRSKNILVSIYFFVNGSCDTIHTTVFHIDLWWIKWIYLLYQCIFCIGSYWIGHKRYGKVLVRIRRNYQKILDSFSKMIVNMSISKKNIL